MAKAASLHTTDAHVRKPGQRTGLDTPVAVSYTHLDVYKRQISKGPMKAQAFGADGSPTKAALGFARSKGVEVSELKICLLYTSLALVQRP